MKNSGHIWHRKKRIATSVETSGEHDLDPRIYVFGSWLWSLAPRDIDLLIVYRSTGIDDILNAVRMREQLRQNVQALLGLQVHFVTLTQSEETQLQFAADTRAVMLYP